MLHRWGGGERPGARAGLVAEIADQPNLVGLERGDRPLEAPERAAGERDAARIVAEQVRADPVHRSRIAAAEQEPQRKRLGGAGSAAQPPETPRLAAARAAPG